MNAVVEVSAGIQTLGRYHWRWNGSHVVTKDFALL